MSWTQTDTSFKKLQSKRITTSTGKGIDEEKGASSLELFCAPRSSMANPSFRPANQQKTFYVHDYGDLDGSTGYWETEEETGQEGVVHNSQDTFWG